MAIGYEEGAQDVGKETAEGLTALCEEREGSGQSGGGGKVKRALVNFALCDLRERERVGRGGTRVGT